MKSLWAFLACAAVVACASPSSDKPVPRPVLIVIAPVDFYYQEYSDPRKALEAAGLTVQVASSRLGAATSHANSWEVAPADSTVSPDLTLADANAADYSALVISGGWGATTYFYAFDGDPVNGNYDKDATASARLNTLINQFLGAGKPVLGVCNGVNVLSWARIDGTNDSPLKGKTVSAPHQPVPAMTYKGVPYGEGSSLEMTQFPLDNDALTVTAKNAVGDTESPRDDVSVDGLILTAQDNLAAYEGGRILARRLLDS